jgi:hypothetical protein
MNLWPHLQAVASETLVIDFFIIIDCDLLVHF